MPEPAHDPHPFTARRRRIATVAGVLTAVILAGGAVAVLAASRQTPARPAATSTASPAPAPRAVPRARPVVVVQAGHELPGEPGYLAQTGATGGPFGSEVAFNIRLASVLAARLRKDGITVRQTPARVTPWGVGGAVFISLHFDTAYGSAGIGYAVHEPGRGENYYHGEGTGTASAHPYPDSAPHRAATAVSYAVQQHSLRLARDLAATFGPIHTPANGAHARFRGVEPGARGNPRMQFFYGYYRVNTQARVLIECGAATLDNAFLRHLNLIAGAISSGIVNYLHQTGQL